VPFSEKAPLLAFVDIEPKHIVGFIEEGIVLFLKKHLESLVSHPLEPNGKATWDLNRIEQDWILNIFVGKPYFDPYLKSMEFRFSLEEEPLPKARLKRILPQVSFSNDIEQIVERHFLHYPLDHIGNILKKIKSIASLVIHARKRINLSTTRMYQVGTSGCIAGNA